MNDQYRRPVTQVDVEERIDQLTVNLEHWVDEYERLAGEDAQAEADWKAAYHTAVLAVLDMGERDRGGRFGDAEARKAEAHRLTRDAAWSARALSSTDEHPDPYRVHLIARSKLDHAKEALRGTSNMLSAQQTLLRSLTHLT